ncbi:MAG: quinone-dependent dihydroorotate dehydrogenase [Patescibacteria group bacterium]
MRTTITHLIRFSYTHIVKKVLFLFNPEAVHTSATSLGKKLGDFRLTENIMTSLFATKAPSIAQSLFTIQFSSPVGLAAGFDYKAELTHVLPCLGFGFGTVGTLTNLPYEGNPRPMLGRLPKSRSLMVNKGFKNRGIEATLETLRDKTFAYPVGVSIGKTNTSAITTQEQAVEDVVAAFIKAEKSEVPFAYYELNISCPNLFGSIEFYEPHHLEQLLTAVQEVGVRRPIFVKMPISKTDEEIFDMMDVIVQHDCIKAVIFGNLQRDRGAPSLRPDEVAQFPKGNFSGIPCQQRSDELIRMIFKKYGSRIKIIGCGGIFSAEDAYRKIKYGASLVQLITGLVFEGPQLTSQINEGLATLLTRDGYRYITEAVGVDA